MTAAVPAAMKPGPSRRSERRSIRPILGRLAASLVTLLVVTFVVFVLIDLAPGDAANAIAGPEADRATIEAVRESLGLDDPVPVRYVRWLGDAVTGDLGSSTVTRRSVTSLIGDALPATVSLVVLSTTAAVIVGMIAGTVCAIRPGRALDRLIVALSSFTLALPSFWVALLLVSIVAVGWRWLPAVGYAPLSEGLWPWLSHLILPAIALAGTTAAELTRQVRGSLQDALHSEYIIAAQARGLSRSRLITKHAMKNAAVPVVTVLGVRIAQLLGSTVIVEQVFAIRGLGTLTIDAVIARDLPIVLGTVVMFSVLVSLANFAVDLSYRYLSPQGAA